MTVGSGGSDDVLGRHFHGQLYALPLWYVFCTCMLTRRTLTVCHSSSGSNFGIDVRICYDVMKILASHESHNNYQSAHEGSLENEYSTRHRRILVSGVSIIVD